VHTALWFESIGGGVRLRGRSEPQIRVVAGSWESSTALHRLVTTTTTTSENLHTSQALVRNHAATIRTTTNEMYTISISVLNRDSAKLYIGQWCDGCEKAKPSVVRHCPTQPHDSESLQRRYPRRSTVQFSDCMKAQLQTGKEA
jgi:hypothetical protein